MLIETQHLAAREFTVNDISFIIELLNTDGWLKYIGNRNVKTHQQALAYLENGAMKSYVDNGFGLNMVCLKETNTPIGMCGFLKRDNLETVDIGFALLPQYAGKGYALEIAKATVQYGFDTLNFNKILAIALLDNYASIKLLQKLHFTFVKQYKDNEEVLNLYELKKL